MNRDFRGVLIGKADKGILLTTGSFTMDAKREAIRDGANAADSEKPARIRHYFFLRLSPGPALSPLTLTGSASTASS